MKLRSAASFRFSTSSIAQLALLPAPSGPAAGILEPECEQPHRSRRSDVYHASKRPSLLGTVVAVALAASAVSVIATPRDAAMASSTGAPARPAMLPELAPATALASPTDAEIIARVQEIADDFSLRFRLTLLPIGVRVSSEPHPKIPAAGAGSFPAIYSNNGEVNFLPSGSPDLCA